MRVGRLVERGGGDGFRCPHWWTGARSRLQQSRQLELIQLTVDVKVDAKGSDYCVRLHGASVGGHVA